MSSGTGQPYSEIDVTAWPSAGQEPLGTKEKRWLHRPHAEESDDESYERWLMKDATYNTRIDGTKYRKGDDWAERIATGVADCLGVPAARTELAHQRIGEEERLGVISKSVLAKNEELVLGNQLLAHPVTRHDRSGYTISAIRKALEDVETPASVGGEVSAWDVFSGYLALDALIGNTDRHEENWAVIDSGTSRRISPTFDHASSLGFLLDPQDRERRLTTRDPGYTPEAWADRAKSTFRGKPHPIDAALAARRMQDTAVQDRWLNRCEDVDRLVEPIWLVPDHRMSSHARDFAERVVRRNRQRLLKG